jgi:hypothetical protein
MAALTMPAVQLQEPHKPISLSLALTLASNRDCLLLMPAISPQEPHKPISLSLVLSLASDRNCLLLVPVLPRWASPQASLGVGLCPIRTTLSTAAAPACWQDGAWSCLLFSGIIIHPINFLEFGQDTHDNSASIQQ